MESEQLIKAGLHSAVWWMRSSDDPLRTFGAATSGQRWSRDQIKSQRLSCWLAWRLTQQADRDLQNRNMDQKGEQSSRTDLLEPGGRFQRCRSRGRAADWSKQEQETGSERG